LRRETDKYLRWRREYFSGRLPSCLLIKRLLMIPGYEIFMGGLKD
jgi:hypothetical protein